MLRRVWRWVLRGFRRAPIPVQLHRIEPGGVLIISGVNPDDVGQHRRVVEVLGAIPGAQWLALPYRVTVDVISPALRSLMVHQLTEQLPTGGHGWFAATEVPDQMISVLCPRCVRGIQMSILVTLSDIDDHLIARAIVDPADVDLHNLSCTGYSPGE